MSQIIKFVEGLIESKVITSEQYSLVLKELDEKRGDPVQIMFDLRFINDKQFEDIKKTLLKDIATMDE